MHYKYRLNHNVSVAGYALSRLKYSAIASVDGLTRRHESKHNFVFIAGCGHSGTTLLAARFGNLPNTYVVPKETYLFRPEKPMFAMRQDFDLWESEASTIGADFIVEKTPKHIHCWHRIKAFVPQAKLVVIYRNPLDTCASLAKRLGDLEFAIERYCIDNKAVVRLMGETDVYHMSYEAFVTSPDEQGRKLVEFTGQTWSDSFVAGGTSTYDSANLTHNMALRQQQVREPIRANIGGWKKELSGEQAKLVSDRTSDVATLLGYAPESSIS